MQTLVSKLQSRRLWIALFFILIAAIDHDLATGIAPVIITYLLGQSLSDAASATVLK